MLSSTHHARFGTVLVLGAVAAFLASLGLSANGESKGQLVRIGTTGTLQSGRSPSEEKAALATLKSFIKDETGFDNQIVAEKNWQALGEQLETGKVQLGAFRGFEFGWAKQRYPGLEPLALAVNGSTYPVVYLVVRKDNKAKDFAGLQGQSIAWLATGQGALARQFVNGEAQAANKEPKTFFSRIVTKDNVEDILDDVVDGTEQAAAVDRAGLEAYKRRKPGRFNQLKEIAKSPPVLPGVIAFHDKQIAAAARERFRKGLLSANQHEKGQTLLTMFRLTGFEAVPADFQQALTRTQKTFPMPRTSK